MSKKLKIIFLGGIGEIGKNLTVFEYGNDCIIVDAGISFPNPEEMPGIDYVMPDFTYLTQNRDKIRGMLLTHGHEDHIGAVPYILEKFNIPVYGSKLTLALVDHKLRERKMNNCNLNVVEDKEEVKLGVFKVEFVRVTHSIAGAFALSIETPKGVVFHTGDFKIDHTPIDNNSIDLARIAEIGKKGVLLLMQDSTNVERSGFSMSEKSVGISLDNIFAQNIRKRLIVATFASNVHRVQQVINCALKYNRKISFSGRSMINVAEIAHGIKELSYPIDQIVEIEKSNKVPYDKLCIITTGTQGEPESALTRMSNSDFKKVNINETDTVVMSSSPIPGNEKMIYNVINNLYRKGADVIYKSLSDVHVSGHACQEELKLMISLVKPKFFIPVHGEYRHLKQHIDLAKNLGINESNMLIPELGSIIGVDKGGLVKMEITQAGNVFIDGSELENAKEILRDRKLLSEDGIIVALININSIIEKQCSTNLICKGINIPDTSCDDIKELMSSKFLTIEYNEGDYAEFKPIAKKVIAKYISQKMKKKPMIIPIVIEN